MKWRGRRGSERVDDRRGQRAPGKRMAVGGIGGLLLLALAYFAGIDPSVLLQGGAGGGVQAGAETRPRPRPRPQAEDELAQMIAVVLADTEDVWRALFDRMDKDYQEPSLVLFTDAVESACGFAQAAVGPFYCSADQSVYIDLAFYEDLHKVLGAPGDFAQAYVIAHEVGHHVQHLLGTMSATRQQQARASPEDANELSVRLELQADFYAGVWAHHAQKMLAFLDPGDIEEALNAASKIGDDRLQKRSQGYVTPETFTHGTSAQRVRWFRLGFETGDLAQGDTFSARKL